MGRKVDRRPGTGVVTPSAWFRRCRAAESASMCLSGGPLRPAWRAIGLTLLCLLSPLLLLSGEARRGESRYGVGAALAGAAAPQEVTRATAVTRIVYTYGPSQNRTEIVFNKTSPTTWSSDNRNYTVKSASGSVLVLHYPQLGGNDYTFDLANKTVRFSHQPRITNSVIVSATGAAAVGPNAEVVRRDLGRGYDATGEFAFEENLKESIFALDLTPEYDLTTFSGTGTIVINSATSATSFSDKLAVSVEGGANLGLFAGSLKASVETSQSGSALTTFTQLDDKFVVFKARLRPGARLKPQAISDFNRLPPDQVVAKYGTHYTNELEFGGKIAYSTFLEQQEVTSSLNIDTAARASYGGLSGAINVGSSQSTTSQTMSSRARFRITGGDGSLNNRSQFNSTAYGAWRRSIPARPALVSFGPTGVTDGLKGIWTIPGAFRPERRRALELAVTRYIRASRRGVFDRPAQLSAVSKQDVVLLQSVVDGTWIGPPATGQFLGTTTSQYGYVARSQQAAGRHALAWSAEPLTSGSIVRLRTLAASLPG
ncbi:MAG: hypothetical protein FJX77_04885, partial [Armatimonadetes bacterium]|nr:hypothetical protein [Armatimonadota bacterium]